MKAVRISNSKAPPLLLLSCTSNTPTQPPLYIVFSQLRAMLLSFSQMRRQLETVQPSFRRVLPATRKLGGGTSAHRQHAPWRAFSHLDIAKVWLTVGLRSDCDASLTRAFCVLALWVQTAIQARVASIIDLATVVRYARLNGSTGTSDWKIIPS